MSEGYTEVNLFTDLIPIRLPDEIKRWDVDDNNERYEFAYERDKDYPMERRFVSKVGEVGLWHLLHNSCSNPFENFDGQEGRKDVREFVVTLHCREFLFLAEAVHNGRDNPLGYFILAAYSRPV